MSSTNLIRFGGLAMIVAGILRGITSFIPNTTPELMLQLLYLFIDILVILGIITLYGLLYQQAGKFGLIVFLITLVGIEIVRSSKAIAGINLYPVGALSFAVGLVMLGLSAWKIHLLPGWIVGLWVVSIVAGAIAAIVPELNWIASLAGTTFAVGFIGTGIKIWLAGQSILNSHVIADRNPSHRQML